MKTSQIKTGRAVALLLAGLLAGAGAMAEKPDWAGGGKHGKVEQNEAQERHGDRSQGKRDRGDKHEKFDKYEKHDKGGRHESKGGHFDDGQRTAVHSYYSEQFRVGRCPPGLAKKNNGCMPPGQARRWSVGQPLPRDVVYYSVPSTVVVQLGAPPTGQRYVRVASDILLIAIGTGMVLDGIEDLGRR